MIDKLMRVFGSPEFPKPSVFSLRRILHLRDSCAFGG
jgi:hypothetical protein